ncbi:MAG: efflux RND transporter periplasmic adaptor subunit [Burkholderiaceae bacterium]|nr:efflux RND transporter periplasmic adaptor subunit [Sulfuritalea sp.]MCF8175982.1 efflux RND transporter periplasmic adaptor subunit [Burkholderiaceae bacterium]MCF8183656.1 efflux RND transporter periplasmic adaptor subunit [Polynucleobacter sp.]
MNTQRLRRFGFIAAAAILIAAFVWVLARSGPLAPVRVVTATVARADIAPMLFGIGVVEARRSYLVGPTSAGRVRSVKVDVGEQVTAGQVLAEMEPVDLDQRYAATSAAAARARNAVDTAAAQLADSVARRRIAAANANRYDDLGRKGFVSISVSEGKSQELKSADAQMAAAESALAAARQDFARLGAERDGAQQQRANLRLQAPVNGIVTARDAEAGSTVVAGQAVLRLIAPDSLWVKLRLDQNRSTGLAPDLPAEIVLRSRPQQTFPGKVARIELISDSVTEERVAQVSFDSVPTGVSVGEMSEITLRLPAIKAALVVPNAALRQRDGKSGVWLQTADGLRFVAVKTGVAGADGMLQILDGLKEGDAVITHSERDLSANTRTKVVSSLIAAAPSAAGK